MRKVTSPNCALPLMVDTLPVHTRMESKRTTQTQNTSEPSMVTLRILWPPQSDTASSPVGNQQSVVGIDGQRTRLVQPHVFAGAINEPGLAGRTANQSQIAACVHFPEISGR